MVRSWYAVGLVEPLSLKSTPTCDNQGTALLPSPKKAAKRKIFWSGNF